MTSEIRRPFLKKRVRSLLTDERFKGAFAIDFPCSESVQVIKFLSFVSSPPQYIQAIISDKHDKVNAIFAPECVQAFERTYHRRLTENTRGCVIRLTAASLYILPSHWINTTGTSIADLANYTSLPTGENKILPVIYIRRFTYGAADGTDVLGSPVALRRRKGIVQLLDARLSHTNEMPATETTATETTNTTMTNSGMIDAKTSSPDDQDDKSQGASNQIAQANETPHRVQSQVNQTKKEPRSSRTSQKTNRSEEIELGEADDEISQFGTQMPLNFLPDLDGTDDEPAEHAPYQAVEEDVDESPVFSSQLPNQLFPDHPSSADDSSMVEVSHASIDADDTTGPEQLSQILEEQVHDLFEMPIQAQSRLRTPDASQMDDSFFSSQMPQLYMEFDGVVGEKQTNVPAEDELGSAHQSAAPSPRNETDIRSMADSPDQLFFDTTETTDMEPPQSQQIPVKPVSETKAVDQREVTSTPFSTNDGLENNEMDDADSPQLYFDTEEAGNNKSTQPWSPVKEDVEMADADQQEFDSQIFSTSNENLTRTDKEMDSISAASTPDQSLVNNAQEEAPIESTQQRSPVDQVETETVDLQKSAGQLFSDTTDESVVAVETDNVTEVPQSNILVEDIEKEEGESIPTLFSIALTSNHVLPMDKLLEPYSSDVESDPESPDGSGGPEHSELPSQAEQSKASQDILVERSQTSDIPSHIQVEQSPAISQNERIQSQRIESQESQSQEDVEQSQKPHSVLLQQVNSSPSILPSSGDAFDHEVRVQVKATQSPDEIRSYGLAQPPFVIELDSDREDTELQIFSSGTEEVPPPDSPETTEHRQANKLVSLGLVFAESAPRERSRKRVKLVPVLPEVNGELESLESIMQRARNEFCSNLQD